MSILQMKKIKSFFNPASATKELNEALKLQKVRLYQLKAEYDVLSTWNQKYVETLSNLTEAMEALIWRKDKDYRYILANPLHCKVFFSYENDDCIHEIEGKTDTELISMNFNDMGIQNTFSEVCLKSEEYVAMAMKIVHFLEAGIIEGKELLLYVIKTPQFDENGNFNGSIGMAWDMSSQSEFIVSQLNRWIYSGKAEKLYHQKNVFCYAINPKVRKCQIFNHICPTPERGKECNSDCKECVDKGIK